MKIMKFKLQFTERFKKQILKLPNNQIRSALKSSLDKLIHDPFYPSLRTEKIQGSEYVFSSRVNKQYRFTWEFKKNRTIRLRNVDDHDELYKKP